jgi:Protein of unknown function (DUF3365)
MINAALRSLLLVSLIASCSKDNAKDKATDKVTPKAPSTSTEVTADERARAAAIVTELKKSLVNALQGALAAGTPSAIEACHSMAPALAASLARDGITVGRATRKPRNPANEASGWQADALTELERAHSEKRPKAAFYMRRLPSGHVGYAEPLVIQELCLNCHGTALTAEVQTALTAKYPTDKATGYTLGELRGIAWVELPRSP